MFRRTRRLLHGPLTAAIVIAGLLAAPGDAGAYTVITRDGFRIEVKQKPEVRGLQAYMRTEPAGRLVVIQEEKIDWARTRAANGAESSPRPLAVRSDETLVEERGGGAPAQQQPTEIRIIGGKDKTGSKQDESGAATGEAGPGEVYASEALINLQKEYARLAAMRDQAAERKKALEAELDDLKGRIASYAGQDDPQVKRARQLQDLVDAETRQIGKLESRLGDIRAEAVQLGGAID